MTNNKTYYFEFEQTKNYWILLVISLLLIFLTTLEIFICIHISDWNFKLMLCGIILAVYLLFVYRTFFWMIFGKEHIEMNSTDLIIKKKRSVFTKPKIYHLSKISNIRIKEQKMRFLAFMVSRTALTSLQSLGNIVFDYDHKSINFGGNIEHQKAEEIIDILKSKLN